MRQTTGMRKSPGEKLVKDIKRATRKQYSSEEKIRIVLDGLRGEDSIAELCRPLPGNRYVVSMRGGQPMTRRDDRSRITARYNQPSLVQM